MTIFFWVIFVQVTASHLFPLHQEFQNSLCCILLICTFVEGGAAHSELEPPQVMPDQVKYSEALMFLQQSWGDHHKV
jgi:hypothetical protein